jgi:hypothetical protein
MIQVLVATAFGSLLALKIFWRRVIGQISSLLSRAKRLRGSVE